MIDHHHEVVGADLQLQRRVFGELGGEEHCVLDVAHSDDHVLAHLPGELMTMAEEEDDDDEQEKDDMRRRRTSRRWRMTMEEEEAG